MLQLNNVFKQNVHVIGLGSKYRNWLQNFQICNLFVIPYSMDSFQRQIKGL